MTDEPKIYEISFLLDEAIYAEEIEAILKNNNAEIIFKKEPEKINLAYPVKKRKQAFFGHFYFRCLPVELENICSLIKQNKKILRSMILTQNKFYPQQEPKNKKDANLENKINLSELENLSGEDLEKKIEELLLENKK